MRDFISPFQDRLFRNLPTLHNESVTPRVSSHMTTTTGTIPRHTDSTPQRITKLSKEKADYLHHSYTHTDSTPLRITKLSKEKADYLHHSSTHTDSTPRRITKLSKEKADYLHHSYTHTDSTPPRITKLSKEKADYLQLGRAGEKGSRGIYPRRIDCGNSSLTWSGRPSLSR